jgi:hypothetical protein
VKTITSARELETFDRLWSERVTEAKIRLEQSLYKLSITRNGRTDRWLYDPAGLVHWGVHTFPSAS